MSALLDTYFATLTAVHAYFGYKEDWSVIPMEDRRGLYWMLVGGEGHGGVCVWSPGPLSEKSVEEGETIYSGPIYTQRFLPKWVYRTESHVMVCVDTQTDMNRLLMIFDADRECTSDAIRRAYHVSWG